MTVLTDILIGMGIARDVCLSHDDADDVNPEVATRLLLPHDADPSTSEVDEIPRERFVGRGVVVRAAGIDAREVVTFASIADQIEDVAPGDIVLFDTGWSRLHVGSERADADYAQNHPTLEPGIIAALLVRGVLAVGIDTPRLDPPELKPGPCAHMLAAASGILCVNLTNLDEIDGSGPLISVSPGAHLTRTSLRVDVTAVALG
ncbi:MAG: cyclase family protein [Microbacteriaceae bacterium]